MALGHRVNLPVTRNKKPVNQPLIGSQFALFNLRFSLSWYHLRETLLFWSHAPIRCVDGVVLWHSPKALKRLAENNTGLKSQATAVSLVRGAVERMNARMNSAEHGSRKEPAKCT
jgi:hypothetical protein